MTTPARACTATVDGVQLTWGAFSHRGRRREGNEDSFLADPPVFAVADGMGGHQGGEVASAAAVDALAPLAGAAATEQALRACLDSAQEEVTALRRGQGRPPGTTVSGALLVTTTSQPRWLIFNIGDSRTYRFAEGWLTQISVDHTVNQEERDAGRFPDPRLKHVITRALGAGGPAVEPDTFALPVKDGDRLLICSDGLNNELGDPRIAVLLGGCPDPQAAAELLVAEACEAGGRDNVTVVVVDIRLNIIPDDADTSSEELETTRPSAARSVGADNPED